ncbi:MAG: FAD-dependent oxidoreductase [Flavobacteriales bacterium]
MDHAYDVIIVGRGIAGVVLGETLLAMGKRVAMFDVAKPNAASPVAAGVVNPVVLRRITLSWRAAEMLALAEPFYRQLEHESGNPFWHPMPLAKLFHTEREAAAWDAHMRDAEVGPFLAQGEVPGFDAGKFNAPFGYGLVKRCAWLDVNAMLAAHRVKWSAMNALVEREVRPEDLHTTDDGVRVHGASAPWLIWCTGPFAPLPGLAPTRGELLKLHLPELETEAMVHRGGFLLPIGNDRYKVGSTFAWDNVWSGPTESGKEELLRKLKNLTPDPSPERGGNRGIHSPSPWERGLGGEVHAAGVRPASRDRRPMLGQVSPHQAVLNGLGSRGVLLAPWCANLLIAHLFNGAPLDPEVDASRFNR